MHATTSLFYKISPIHIYNVLVNTRGKHHNLGVWLAFIKQNHCACGKQRILFSFCTVLWNKKYEGEVTVTNFPVKKVDLFAVQYS